MQPESKFASSFSESVGIEENHAPPQLLTQITHTPPARETQAEAVVKPRESRLDIVSAAVVVGMTAQFVVFIFGLVTEFIPRLIETILISAFIGLCVSVIAYALMKGND